MMILIVTPAEITDSHLERSDQSVGSGSRWSRDHGAGHSELPDEGIDTGKPFPKVGFRKRRAEAEVPGETEAVPRYDEGLFFSNQSTGEIPRLDRQIVTNHRHGRSLRRNHSEHSRMDLELADQGVKTPVDENTGPREELGARLRSQCELSEMIG